MFLVNRNVIMTSKKFFMTSKKFFMTSKKFFVSTIIIILDKQSESHDWSTQIAAK